MVISSPAWISLLAFKVTWWFLSNTTLAFGQQLWLIMEAMRNNARDPEPSTRNELESRIPDTWTTSSTVMESKPWMSLKMGERRVTFGLLLWLCWLWWWSLRKADLNKITNNLGKFKYKSWCSTTAYTKTPGF